MHNEIRKIFMERLVHYMQNKFARCYTGTHLICGIKLEIGYQRIDSTDYSKWDIHMKGHKQLKIQVLEVIY